MNALVAKEDFGHPKKVLDMREILVSDGKKETDLYEFAQRLAWLQNHDGLLEHIKENGLKNPIAVIEREGKYYHAFAYARVQCAIKLGYTHIDCIILKKEEDLRPLMIEQAKTGEKNFCVEPENKWWERKEEERFKF